MINSFSNLLRFGSSLEKKHSRLALGFLLTYLFWFGIGCTPPAPTPSLSFSPPSGTYATYSLNVSLSYPGASALYYTIDGSTPTTSSSQYLGPIALTSESVVQYFTIRVLPVVNGVEGPVVNALYELNISAVDSDSDSIINADDSEPFNNLVCMDSDNDTCEDCSSGSFDPANDGLDTDSNGMCDASDYITVAFSGVITQVSDFDGLGQGQAFVGQTFSGTYSFNKTEPGVIVSSSDARYYYDNVAMQFSMTANIGTLVFQSAETDPFNFSTEIDVNDNYGGGTPRDTYRVFTREMSSSVNNVAIPLDFGVMDMTLTTFNNLNTIVGSDLPLIMPDLANFESTKNITFHLSTPMGPGMPKNFFARGDIQTLTVVQP